MMNAVTVSARLPSHLADIQSEVNQIITAAEKAAESVENSPAYMNRLDPFHAAAVATYNRLVTVLLSVEGFRFDGVSE